MAETVSMVLADLVRTAEQQGNVDFLRQGVPVPNQALREVEVCDRGNRASPRMAGAGG